MEKNFIKKNLKFVYLCVREKNNGFQITVTVLTLFRMRGGGGGQKTPPQRVFTF